MTMRGNSFEFRYSYDMNHTVRFIPMINHSLKILPKRDRGKIFSELVEPINK